MSVFRCVAVVAACAGIVCAQDVISAKSGLIHYFEGVVTVDGKDLVKKTSADFPSVPAGSELQTKLGRAEVLLSPGVFLRVAENSGVKLVSNDITDTRLALTSGSVLVEVGELEKNASLTVVVGETKLELNKRGLFRVDASPARVRVYDGSVVVVAGGQTVTVREGREAELTGAIAQSKFNKEETDAFYRWAQRRSGYIATANLTAAKRAYDSGTYGSYSSWMWNPYFGMFTFVPMNGFYRSPFGYRYYSPNTIAGIYYHPYYSGTPASSSMGGWSSPSIMDSGRGMSSMGGHSGSYSGGGVTAAPSMSSAPAAPSGGSRGGASAAAGGGGGRGR